jgi:ArsR family transcriptional regulator
MGKVRVLADPSTLFRAFADPTRLRILSLLIERELCVCDLCEVIGEIQPKVSRHLAYLRRSGLVSARQEARWTFYRITSEPTSIQKTLLQCVGSCLRDFAVLSADLRRLKALPRRESRCA